MMTLSQVSVTHSEFASRDPEMIREYLSRAYGVKLKVSGLKDNAAVEHVLTVTPRFSIAKAVLPGTIHFACDPMSWPIVTTARRGLLEIDCTGSSDRPDHMTPLLTPRNEPYAVAMTTATLQVASFDPDLLQEAAGTPLGEPAPLRFRAGAPPDPAGAALWSAATTFVGRQLAGVEELSPLIAGQTGRLLATTALSVFPHEIPEPRPCERADATPLTLRRAIAFIDAHAHQDLTLADIAAAVHVAPRTLQHAFRRYRDTTPLAYLRTVRLARAHQDLLTAAPAHATVARIAARWGFAQPGRFAAYYRAMYGRSPQQTLRHTS